MYYNNDRKQRYIDSLNGVNVISPDYIFNKAFKVEERYGKDLCDFVPEEIEDLLYALKTKSTGFLKIALKTLEDYTNFCVVHNYKLKQTMNFYQIMNTTNDKLERFIDMDFRERRYILPLELKDTMDAYFVNDIDKVLFQMLWEGFTGTGMTELMYLKIQDVDFNELTIDLVNENQERVGNWHITQRLADYIKDSRKEHVYRPMTDNMKALRNLVDTDFVFRATHSKRETEDHISRHGLYTRYNKIIKLLDMQYTKIGTIGISSALYLALLVKASDKSLMDDETQFYRVVASYSSRKKVQSGAAIKHQIDFNLNKVSLTEDDIDKDVIETMVKNLDILKNKKDADLKYIDYITRVQQAIGTLI